MARKRRLRIASYNINGINTRLPVLTRWLAEVEAGHRRPPGAEMHRRGVSGRGDRGARLFRHLARPEKLERSRPAEPRRSAGRNPPRPARPIPSPSKAATSKRRFAGSSIGNLYLPNGNPWPGPKFDYKLDWMDRLARARAGLLDSGVPALLIGDFNVIPTDQDVYKPERWAKDALFSPAGQGEVCRARRAGLDRRDPPAPPGRAHLHLLALLAEQLRARRRHPHRPCAAQPGPRQEAQGGRASTATPRGWEKTSDHAPMWIDITV